MNNNLTVASIIIIVYKKRAKGKKGKKKLWLPKIYHLQSCLLLMETLLFGYILTL